MRSEWLVLYERFDKGNTDETRFHPLKQMKQDFISVDRLAFFEI